MLLDRRRVKFWQRIVFGSLAAIFAVSFVIGGVGSGTNFSVSDIFNNGGGNSASTVPSNVSKAKKATQLHPKDPRAWAGYGQALQGNNQLPLAIAAYQKAIKLDPNNLEYRETLASYYSGTAATAAQQAQNLQLEAYTLQQQQTSSLPFNGVVGSQLGSVLSGQVSNAQNSQISEQVTKLQGRAQIVTARATSNYKQALAQYRVITTKTPDDPSGWYKYGSAARAAGDNTTAVAALKHFLKLAPDAPESPTARAVIKELSPPKGSGSGTTTTASG
jgi:Flp pilus assembly protein TadD